LCGVELLNIPKIRCEIALFRSAGAGSFDELRINSNAAENHKPATYGFEALQPGITGTTRGLKGLNYFKWLGPFVFFRIIGGIFSELLTKCSY
jgi:hypothetical protein